jgi:outer membrane protein OmpA-like peptidoglycan-associated protein
MSAVASTQNMPEPNARPASSTALLAGFAGILVGVFVLGVVLLVVFSTVRGAAQRLVQPNAEKPKVAVADNAEVGYCTQDFKKVLERVLHSCGLSTTTERRGCKPSDIKTFAAINDDDFNALFHPLRDRGGVLMFDEGSDVLDEEGQKLLEERWFERKGARYFFVVARASKTGTPAQNRALSHRRANSVMFALQKISGESEEELNQRVGLLWLGNEYAQLSQEYCEWPRSRSDAPCDEEPINRSAFVSWVDCRL